MQPDLIKTDINDHNEMQRTYYGTKIKKTMTPVDSYYVNRHVDKLITASGIEPAHQILEVGCGMGKFTLPLLDKGFQITGVDLSPFLLEQFQEYNTKAHHVELICSDILDMPKKLNARFDHVIGFFTLHHFLELEEYFVAMAKLLKPGGKISFVEPNPYNPLYYVQMAITPSMTWKGDKGILNMVKGKFQKAATHAQLNTPQITKYGFFPPFVVNKNPGRVTENFLEKLKIFKGVSAFQVVSFTKP